MRTHVALLVLILAPAAVAQPVDSLAQHPSLDREVLLAIYQQDDHAFRALAFAADRSARPLFLLAVPVMLGASLLADGESSDFGPPYRLALAQAGTLLAVHALKPMTRRPRPFLVEKGVEARTRRHLERPPSYSLPSTHAAMAAAIATSVSLSHPEWWVVVPAASWALAVSLSRPWLGLHYPSDLLAGWAVGGGLALVVHGARDTITPASFSRASIQPDALFVPLLRMHW